MTQQSWPFHNGSTGTPVLEDQWSIMARQWAASGVVGSPGDLQLQVWANSAGRQVYVRAGRASVRGHWLLNDADATITIAANSSGNPRIDRIVARLDPAANSVTLAVKQGSPSGSPSAPALTQTDTGMWELTLAKVTVANGAVSIAAGDVTDERVYAPPPAMLATSARRPVNPVTDQIILEADTGLWKRWTGSAWVDTAAIDTTARATANAALPKAGGTMTGNINMNGRYLLNIGQSGDPADAATVGQVNAASAAAAAANSNANSRVSKTGDTMTGALVIVAGNGYSTVDAYSAGIGWRFGIDPGAGNAWTLNRVDGSGTHLWTAIRVDQSSGACYIIGSPSLTRESMPAADGPGGINIIDHDFLVVNKVNGQQAIERYDGLVIRDLMITLSTRRLKDSISDAFDVPDVTRLQPSSFRWTAGASLPFGSDRDRPQLGLIAEDVATVDERLVHHGEDGKPAALNTGALIAALVAKVTELQTRIEALEGA